jgi:hypothetical protein
MSGYSEDEQAIDALLVALVTQANEVGDGKFSTTALEHIVDQGRATVRLLLGCIGHLVHYDSTGEDNAYSWLAVLFEELIIVLRRLHHEQDGLLPGDTVELAVARPDLHLQTGTVMRVYWVGDDGTVDVGHESLAEEYVISTVRRSDIETRPSV